MRVASSATYLKPGARGCIFMTFIEQGFQPCAAINYRARFEAIRDRIAAARLGGTLFLTAVSKERGPTTSGLLWPLPLWRRLVPSCIAIGLPRPGSRAANTTRRGSFSNRRSKRLSIPAASHAQRHRDIFGHTSDRGDVGRHDFRCSQTDAVNGGTSHELARQRCSD